MTGNGDIAYRWRCPKCFARGRSGLHNSHVESPDHTCPSCGYTPSERLFRFNPPHVDMAQTTHIGGPTDG